VADEAVLNIVRVKRKNPPKKYLKKKNLSAFADRSLIQASLSGSLTGFAVRPLWKASLLIEISLSGFADRPL
jgi:hypothetical protein